MSVLYGAILFALVAAFVLTPVLSRRSAGEGEDPHLADLEARRESKYREIRDAELDHASGKLSDADFERQDAELRSEAVRILEELDAARAEAGSDPARDDMGASG